MKQKPGKIVVSILWVLSLLLSCAGGLFIGRGSGASDAKLAEIEGIIQQYYYKDVSDEDLEEGVLHGLVLALGDPYSMYMNKEEKRAYNETLEGQYSGIGVLASMDKSMRPVIAQVYRGTPAEQAGLQKGDVIIAVDGEEIDLSASADLSKVTGKIRGEEDTEVSITVERNGQKKEFTMKRKTVQINYVTCRMLTDTVGYIKIDEFSGSALTEYQAAVKELQEKGMQKLVLDLRDNPGGFVDYAVEIADELLPEGTIMSIKDKNGQSKEYKSDASAADFPMAVLCNGNSASASEILIAALKDYNRAAIIGEKTYGKGIIQSHFDLSWGGYLKLTTASYYSPNGNAIHEVGIEPNEKVSLPVEVQNGTAELTDQNDTQLQKALEVLSK